MPKRKRKAAASAAATTGNSKGTMWNSSSKKKRGSASSSSGINTDNAEKLFQEIADDDDDQVAGMEGRLLRWCVCVCLGEHGACRRVCFAPIFSAVKSSRAIRKEWPALQRNNNKVHLFFACLKYTFYSFSF